MQRMRKHISKNKYISKVPACLILIGLILWTFLPIYNMIVTSFKTWDDIWITTYLPPKPTLEAYLAVLTQSYFRVEKFWLWMLNSLRIALETMALSLLVGLLAGYAISNKSKISLRARSCVANVSLLSYIFPASLLSIPLFALMMYYKLLNTDWAVSLSLTALVSPFNTWMAAEYFNSIPREIEEAAEIDGASAFKRFRMILLPLITPAIVALSVWSFLYSWNNYLYPLLMISDENRFLLPIAMGFFLSTDDSPWNIFMAVGIIYAIPPLILYYMFKRYIVSGLFRGAVKY